MSKTYMVISDLHMSDGSPSDRFTGDGTELINKIKEINPDVLILAGDIYEGNSLTSIRRAHKKFFNFIKERKTIILRGNHDWSLFRKSHYIFELEGETYFVAHGHQISHGVVNTLLRTLEDFIELLEEKLCPNKTLWKPTTVGSYTGAMQYAEKKLKKYDNVILGHTHKEEILETENGTYYNSGSCSKGQIEYTLI